MIRSSILLLVAIPLTGCNLDLSSDPPSGTFGQTVVTGGGSSFGECTGFCQSDLAFRADGHVVLTRSTWDDGTPPIINEGILTAEAQGERAELGDELRDASIADTYGCPDCADGGTGYLYLIVGDLGTRTAYEYAHPPALLAHADEVVSDLVNALGSCRSSDRLTVYGSCTRGD